ncbi:hypothetical protein OSH26_17010, partial [Mycobacterium ulcerans]
ESAVAAVPTTADQPGGAGGDARLVGSGGNGGNGGFSATPAAGGTGDAGGAVFGSDGVAGLP